MSNNNNYSNNGNNFSNGGNNNNMNNQGNNNNFVKPREMKFVSLKSILQMQLSKDGSIIFQIANASGTTQNGGKNLPVFDYSTKMYFGFSNVEAATIVLNIEKFLANPKNFKMSFPHNAGRDPKTIEMNFSLYNNQIPQCGIAVYCKNNEQRKGSIYLKEAELEIIKENLKAQYILKL